MFKSEPKTILQFLATHFDLLRQLFDIQVENDIILKNQVYDTLKEFGNNIENQLFEHKLLVEQNDNYVINEPYFILFEFVLQQFKPLLPEEIEKFGQSIRALFLKIKTLFPEIKNVNQDKDILLNRGDKNILLDRIEALVNEIRKFTNAVINNTSSLLNESRELKANTSRMEYQEKIQKARHLTKHYVAPLTKILDVNHSQSIYNELLDISKFSNGRRFDYTDENIRRQFEKLYNLLRQAENDIMKQNTILFNDLSPLLYRVETENEYLQGFHLYLTNGNCYKGIKPPKLLNIKRDNIYNQFIHENTKEYFDQFKNEEDVFIEEETNIVEHWIFDKSRYKSQLNSELPINDFFTWCKTTLENENFDFDFDDYFMVTSLIFEKDFQVQQDKEHQTISVKTEKGELIMPKLKITKNENVPE